MYYQGGDFKNIEKQEPEFSLNTEDTDKNLPVRKRVQYNDFSTFDSKECDSSSIIPKDVRTLQMQVKV